MPCGGVLEVELAPRDAHRAAYEADSTSVVVDVNSISSRFGREPDRGDRQTTSSIQLAMTNLVKQTNTLGTTWAVHAGLLVVQRWNLFRLRARDKCALMRTDQWTNHMPAKLTCIIMIIMHNICSASQHRTAPPLLLGTIISHLSAPGLLSSPLESLGSQESLSPYALITASASFNQSATSVPVPSDAARCWPLVMSLWFNGARELFLGD